MVVPQPIRILAGCREIRRSLGTRSRRSVLIRSCELSRQVRLLFARVFRGNRRGTPSNGVEPVLCFRCKV
ncbi:hypothetical protein [Marinobacter salarius]|uniref:hypothetical protein n=1 Tax=Marinobacter salarius TaxID=1420917 RepID=UPI0038793D3F